MRYDEYPPEYRQMFQRAQGFPVTLKFTTREKAVSFRVELYKYRYAIRDALPKTKTLYNQVMKIRLEVTGKVLILRTKKSKFVEKLNEH